MTEKLKDILSPFANLIPKASKLKLPTLKKDFYYPLKL